MPKAIVVVRELGRQSADYSLVFDFTSLPRVGDYISIYRPDAKLHSEDLVVRHVWWQLDHPTTDAVGPETGEVGRVRDIFVECDQAIGPHSRDRWRDDLERAVANGAMVERFKIARFSLREEDLANSGKK